MTAPSCMRPRRRFTLRSKVAALAGVPLVILAVAVPVLYLVGRAAGQAADGIEEVYRARAGIAAVRRNLVDAEHAARGYLLTHDARFLQPYRVGAGSLSGNLARVRTLLASAETAPTLDRIDELADSRLTNLRRQIEFADSMPIGEIPTRLLADGIALADGVEGALAELDATQIRLLETRRNEIDRVRRTATLVSVIVVPVAVLASILLVLAFTQRLVRRIRHIERNARRLETGEPLDVVPGNDEIASLAETLAQIGERLVEQDAELRELALVDPLTGLRNRRGFLELAEHELAVCQRHGSRTTLFYVDVDGLKRVNDEQGHAAGDRLLRDVARILRESTRSSDIVARIGGDEFCVLLAREGAPDSHTVLTKIESARDRHIALDGVLTVSFSVGTATFEPAAPASVEDLIDRADRQMYVAKRIRAAATGA